MLRIFTITTHLAWSNLFRMYFRGRPDCYELKPLMQRMILWTNFSQTCSNFVDIISSHTRKEFFLLPEWKSERWRMFHFDWFCWKLFTDDSRWSPVTSLELSTGNASQCGCVLCCWRHSLPKKFCIISEYLNHDVQSVHAFIQTLIPKIQDLSRPVFQWWRSRSLQKNCYNFANLLLYRGLWWPSGLFWPAVMVKIQPK